MNIKQRQENMKNLAKELGLVVAWNGSQYRIGPAFKEDHGSRALNFNPDYHSICVIRAGTLREMEVWLNGYHACAEMLAYAAYATSREVLQRWIQPGKQG